MCKVDWALSGPVPWQAEACREAGTVHLGGTLDEVARSEAEVHAGRLPERPFCIVVQAGVADPTRAPAGQHTLWAYCHVPAGSPPDMTGLIEAQVERFAPGFRDLVLARTIGPRRTWSATTPTTSAATSTAGRHPDPDHAAAHATLEPLPDPGPRRVPVLRSTPPGGGVHGMCGDGAARAVLADLHLPGGG